MQPRREIARETLERCVGIGKLCERRLRDAAVESVGDVEGGEGGDVLGREGNPKQRRLQDGQCPGDGLGDEETNCVAEVVRVRDRPDKCRRGKRVCRWPGSTTSSWTVAERAGDARCRVVDEKRGREALSCAGAGSAR